MPLPPLRILAFPETPKSWTARSLEHDLAAGGCSAESAIDTLVKIAQAHILYDTRHGHAPLSAFRAAPQVYWNAFSRAQETSKPLEGKRIDSGTELQYYVEIVPQNPLLARKAPLARFA